MPAPSLLQLSTAAAVRNLKYLDDIGNIPYALARPFLLKIESPEKLRSIELQSPHIMPDDNEIWLCFIKRDIPKWEEYDIPENLVSWYDVYCDLRAKLQQEVDKDAEKLKMALDGIHAERAKHSSKLIPSLVQGKPTARQRYASYDRKAGGIAPVFTATSDAMRAADPLGAPAWTFERPAIPRSASSSDLKKKGIFSAQKKNKALAVPTKLLHNKASQIKVAPRSLIEDHKQPPGRPPAITRNSGPNLRVPGRARAQPLFGSTEHPITPSLQEKEARLRALTTGRSTASQTPKMPTRSSPTPSSSKDAPTSAPVKKATDASRQQSPPQASSVKSTATPAKLLAKRSYSESSSAEPDLRDASQEQKRKAVKRLSPDSRDNSQEPNRKTSTKRASPDSRGDSQESQKTGLKRASPETSSDGDGPQASTAKAPPVAKIKKRPAPSIFLTPKKRKVT